MVKIILLPAGSKVITKKQKREAVKSGVLNNTPNIKKLKQKVIEKRTKKNCIYMKPMAKRMMLVYYNDLYSRLRTDQFSY